ncbi:hypothetical protein E0Z10_g17 [Xylaria hypoxylon]|uniref:Uncharacterized protein n=1 Tax=Xylaria hypoxylon TaxID=37992 RepID=A0A4Z0ZG67_9PEZI|nr:hypothetical protein E0Z10_g17 [Xylaria hypoxylon]
MPSPNQTIQARIQARNEVRIRQSRHRNGVYKVRGSLACVKCFHHYNAAESRRDNGLPLQVICTIHNLDDSCKRCKLQDDFGCESLPAMLHFDATRLDELLNWSFWLFGRKLQDPYNLDCLLHTHQLAFELLGNSSDTKISRAAYQTQVLQRKRLIQQSVQPIPSDPDWIVRASYDRATTLRVQPFDDGYVFWMLAVHVFMEELEELVVGEYDQTKWEERRQLLVNEDVLEFCEG